MARKKHGRKIRIRHILMLLVIFYLGSIFISQQKMINKLDKERQEKKQEITNLENDIKNLEGKIQYTDSLEYIEKIAREELKMVMPDEIIYIDIGKDKNGEKQEELNEDNKGIDE